MGQKAQFLTKYGEVEARQEGRGTVISPCKGAPPASDRAGLENWSAGSPSGVTLWRELSASKSRVCGLAERWSCWNQLYGGCSSGKGGGRNQHGPSDSWVTDTEDLSTPRLRADAPSPSPVAAPWDRPCPACLSSEPQDSSRRSCSLSPRCRPREGR